MHIFWLVSWLEVIYILARRYGVYYFRHMLHFQYALLGRQLFLVAVGRDYLCTSYAALCDVYNTFGIKLKMTAEVFRLINKKYQK